MTVQFDNKITLGNVLVVIGMLVSGVSAFVYLQAGQAKQASDMVRLERIMAEQTDTLSRQRTEQEGRLRAVEVAQAAQSSDLRNIQTLLTRIELQLERIKPE